jgi:prepilin-type N-terminal cleavage/methylation domain-containing protein/prepilin-type processing-associated H-X9-DG protein
MRLPIIQTPQRRAVQTTFGKRGNRPRGAFTLIELLVVIAVVAILIALLIAAVQRVRVSAAQAQCANNLRQIGLAVHGYYDVYGSFPAPDFPFAHSWMYQIFPYIEQDAAYQEGRDIDTYLAKTYTRIIPEYICPLEPRGYLDGVSHGTSPVTHEPITCGMTNYVGVLGKGRPRENDHSSVTGVFGSVTILFFGAGLPRIRIADVTDGVSQTLMAGERPPSLGDNVGWWAILDPNDNTIFAVDVGPTSRLDGTPCPTPAYFSPGDLNDVCHLGHFWSFHPGGGNWLLCDGSVRFMGYAAGTTVVPAMATINGGEDVALPD